MLGAFENAALPRGAASITTVGAQILSADCPFEKKVPGEAIFRECLALFLGQ
jgi:hypothetical protein